LKRSAGAERTVGIEWYITDGDPCSAQARASPEDFLVEEKLSVPEMVAEPLPDYFPLYRIEKHSIDTMHMARELSDALKGRVSYAGLKDKRAVAVQYATPASRRSDRPQQVATPRFTATIVGFLPRPLGRGSLVGNAFSIVLRNCCSAVEDRVAKAMEAAEEGKVPNYYGLQRFGTVGTGTHLVGGAMVRGEFEAAGRLLLGAGQDSEILRALEAGRYRDLPGLLPAGKDVETWVARELGRRPGDWVGAIRAVPVNLRRLYVQAYQSYIFNRTLSIAVEKGEDLSKLVAGDNWAQASSDGLVISAPRGVKDAPTTRAVPLVQVVGYAFRNYGSRFDLYLLQALEAEGVRPGRFFIEQMQEASQEGGFRRPALVARDETWEVQDGKASLKFVLPRGQYATVLLREIVKAEDPAGAKLA
jgi:tRNA pseudouridine13 synthase